MARICGLCPSMPMWILRHGRRFGPPCPRAFHSPSPSASMPVPSTARQGIAKQCPRGDRKVQRALRTPTGDVHGRGLPASAMMPKSGTARSGPTRRRRRSTKPDVWRRAMPERTFIPLGILLLDTLPGSGQACPDRRVTGCRLPTALAGRWRHPDHFRIEPTSWDIAVQCPAGPWIAGNPRCSALCCRSARSRSEARRCGSAHAPPPPRRIHKMNPGQYLCNKAPQTQSLSGLTPYEDSPRSGHQSWIHPSSIRFTKCRDRTLSRLNESLLPITLTIED